MFGSGLSRPGAWAVELRRTTRRGGADRLALGSSKVDWEVNGMAERRWMEMETEADDDDDGVTAG